ncbi:hypothetical protein C3747_11g83 [Trypanosoma cruzi]|uniref:B30.2/SPRY domain-containing protein n=2 Tax=Trypanosoma cruzi TaxID=5693 RepID=Q4DA14_TRYCC|nr:hypothetical protein, conserved [Trypanosoma cruzi]EAN89355.1 hypothetical protein, conserved [Trypanosoma cruzi]PWV18976.1 hypothetical protein C3747_11g83 [Trypanosoma cruzi]RNC59428.1 hypothetical protein TcCL_ESM02874 [Trypanosoma cruzi]|eukprot:XP_811206.1 hypothetical protein [Trypanosoma cruzi strain CL Brener]
MFYSGWQFPTPQRIVASDSQQDANYFIQETCSPGICLIHFLSTSMRPGVSASAATAAASAASRRENNGRIHLKSDVPIHPYSGVFYFEVEVRSIATAGGNGRNSVMSLSEPELVIGICRESLPQHALPGEEAWSIGLFTAQRMAYINGKGEGEAVRFPTGARQRNSSTAAGNSDDYRARGMKVGDTVGCIVNLMEGTVRFTFNGELLDVVGTLSRRMPRHGYYPAVGMFRLLPAVSLRVVFPPLGRAASILRPPMKEKVPPPPPPPPPAAAAAAAVTTITTATAATTAAVPESGTVAAAAAAAAAAAGGVATAFSPQQEMRTTAAGYFVFNMDKYCEGIAEELVRVHQKKTAADLENECEEDSTCSCRDANIMAAIRKHLAARGMTKALSAFEKEREELQCATAATRVSSPLQEGMGLQSAEETHATRGEDNSKKSSKGAIPGGSGSSRNKISSKLVEEECQGISYSLHIQQLREDIGRGDMISGTQRILAAGVISPTTREKIASVTEDVNLLPNDFWGIIFFAQRRDILFLLRAAHLVEVTLDAMEKGLGALLSRLIGTEEPNRGATGDSTGATHVKTPITTAELMRLALHILLQPFEEVSAAARHHQRASSVGARTGDAAAFGMLDETLAKGESKWPCDDLAAHLFFTGDKTLWSGPEAPVTLLVRRSVPNMPPPKPKHQRQIVETLSMLLSHQRAVCAREEEQRYANENRAWVENWLLLVKDAKIQYRARCWCLLLHAIEDFNGALEYRLLVWLRRHEEEMREAEKGGGLGRHGATTHHREGAGRRLFPSLRSAWRHVHAAAALEPLFNIVTKAFSDRLYRASTAAQLATMAAQNGRSSTFEKGPKRNLSFRCDFMNSEEDEGRYEHGPQPGELASESGSTLTARNNNNKNELLKKTSCYNDDVRLSFLYMKSIYRAVFA